MVISNKDTMNDKVGEVVLPGDIIADVKTVPEKIKIILGPGLRQEIDKIQVSKAGVLRKKEPITYWVDNFQKRYVPIRGENVIGVVIHKVGDIFRVDIGSSSTAALSYLAFEGATKKQRPDVQIGDLVYAKLLVASKNMESELVCVDSHGKRGRLGLLNDGFMFTCSLNLVRKILNPKCCLLESLQKELPFELAAGMNGRIWIKANSSRETVAVGNAILASEFRNEDEIHGMCSNIATLLATGY